MKIATISVRILLLAHLYLIRQRITAIMRDVTKPVPRLSAVARSCSGQPINEYQLKVNPKSEAKT
jgi:hypothetical protein